MQKIGSDLLKLTSTIDKSIRADLVRAKTAKSCKKSINVKQYDKTRANLLQQIKDEVNQNILRTIDLCGTDCLELSFNRERDAVKHNLALMTSQAKKLAKGVVKCAGTAKKKSPKKAARTDTRLDSQLKTVDGLNVNCKVCSK